MSTTEIMERFRGVENSAPASPAQQEAVSQIRAAVLNAALMIDQWSTHPRYRATALTDLETAAMFAVKGVFQA
jgi:hypothetical protein